ncbi:hypothetical protein RRG08_039462 [Elysia crispata]|uniref:Secreted protein n=1 Tax=Elysia crispata TaxID=231223 RepID=A0AAE0YJL8_9GAST|nr:hypothetical protein RRG08_039462 [Elysia crispata]
MSSSQVWLLVMTRFELAFSSPVCIDSSRSQLPGQVDESFIGQGLPFTTAFCFSYVIPPYAVWPRADLTGRHKLQEMEGRGWGEEKRRMLSSLMKLGEVARRSPLNCLSVN